jgi:hypothetical protein
MSAALSTPLLASKIYGLPSHWRSLPEEKRDPADIESTLRSWHPLGATVEFLDYRAPRGLPRVLADMTNQIPVARYAVPSLVHVMMANATSLPTTNANTVAGETSPTSGHEGYGSKNLTTFKELQMAATTAMYPARIRRTAYWSWQSPVPDRLCL